MQFVEK